MKRYGYPLIVIVVSSIVLYFFRAYINITDSETIYVILSALALFVFGVYLNTYHKKKSDTWVKKFAVFFAFMLLVFMQLGIFEISIISKFFSVIKANYMIYDMFYIYLGYVFF